jgi:[ribosomal protein S5]-alanine N-acetyltransferase
MTIITQTPRLLLRKLELSDASFILEITNTAGWLKFIGDRGIRNEQHAQDYLRNGPLLSYIQHDFGLWMVLENATTTPVGMCGLLKRDTLQYPDVGFALLPAFEGHGYATEAVRAVLALASARFDLKVVSAITNLDNSLSQKVLKKCGFEFHREFVNEKSETLNEYRLSIGGV